MSDLITSQMLSDWRANYGLDKRTPTKAMHWWQDNMDGKAPAGVVAALGLCINEIERLTAENKMLRHTHRWNVSPQVDDSLLVCRHLHEKDEKCDLEHYVPAGRLHDAIRERDELRDVLLRNGFVPCDIPACNCGSWHHRYGLPERMQEIKDALAEAGQELSNANGHLPINALKALVAERDELHRQLAEAEPDARRYRWLRNEANTARKCDPMVCIYPLDEQDLIDGDRLDVAIDAAMGASNE